MGTYTVLAKCRDFAQNNKLVFYEKHIFIAIRKKLKI